MTLSRCNLFFLQRYAALPSLASLIYLSSVLFPLSFSLCALAAFRERWRAARISLLRQARTERSRDSQEHAQSSFCHFSLPLHLHLLGFISFYLILPLPALLWRVAALPTSHSVLQQTKQNKNQANMRSPRQLATMVSKRRSSSPLSTTSLRGTAAAFPPDLSCLATSPAGPRLWVLPSSASPRSPRNPKSPRRPRSPSRRRSRRASRPPSGGSLRLPRT